MNNIDKSFTSGIYKIVNTKNSKFYIGSSKRIEYRWNAQHKIKLIAGNHVNIILQRAWDKYGSENFKLEILELINGEKELLEREQHYIDTLKPAYNISIFAAGGDNLTNHPNRLEIIERIKKSTHKRVADKGVEYWAAWGERYSGANNPNYGNTWSDEQKANNSKKLKDYYETHDSYKKGKNHIELFGKDKADEISNKLSNIAKLRTGSKNSFYGKTHSDEFKKQMSERKKGIKPTNSIKVQINDIIYDSLSEACRMLNIPTPTIHHRINSKNKKFDMYKYLN